MVNRNTKQACIQPKYFVFFPLFFFTQSKFAGNNLTLIADTGFEGVTIL